MNPIQALTEALTPEGFSLAYGREDGIPYLSLWTEDVLVSFAQAVSLAKRVQGAFDCPVHFHRLEGTSMSFFVFEGGPFADWKLQEYGTPVAEWLKTVAPEPEPERYTMRGVFDDEGVLQPSQEHRRGGFIWTRSPRFFSNALSGKWCIVRSAAEVDALWVHVRQAVLEGKLSAAMVSSPRQAASHGGTYVICAFTDDWRNRSEVDAARELLRAFGVTEDIGYKRDVDTVNNVYGGDAEWTYRS